MIITGASSIYRTSWVNWTNIMYVQYKKQLKTNKSTTIIYYIITYSVPKKHSFKNFLHFPTFLLDNPPHFEAGYFFEILTPRAHRKKLGSPSWAVPHRSSVIAMRYFTVLRSGGFSVGFTSCFDRCFWVVLMFGD